MLKEKDLVKGEYYIAVYSESEDEYIALRIGMGNIMSIDDFIDKL